MIELFNISTLMLCLCAGSAVIALFASAAWLKERENRELLCWALAYWSCSVGVLLISCRNLLPDWLALGVGNLIALFAVSLFWLGFRVFDKRPLLLAGAGMGPFVWACAYFLSPAFAADINARIILMSLLISVYSGLVAHAAWQGRKKEKLSARTGITLLFGTHAVVYLMRAPLALLAPVTVVNGMPHSLWHGVLTFELFLHSLLAGFSLFVLVHERLELRYRTASEVDELTGIFNRRAFISYVEQLRRGKIADGTMALLDIDHFKRINDTYGHGAGDEALRIFSRVIAERIEPGMIFGRVGGEEFALYLPGCSLERGRAFCEGIRQAVEEIVIPLGSEQLRITVSQGLSADITAHADITFLLGIADRALYISKRNGRNRVTTLNASAGLKMMATLMSQAEGGQKPRAPADVAKRS